MSMLNKVFKKEGNENQAAQGLHPSRRQVLSHISLRLSLFSLLLTFFLAPSTSRAWGFWAHQRINRMAVFTLPPEMIPLYKKYIDYLTEHAVDPDMRRYAVEGEAPKHYIDIDHYGTSPFEVVPQKWKDAAAKYSEDTLQAYGIVPWHIQRMYYDLVDAFKVKDLYKIMKISADFGHYIADANVPLHTTENYNGQLTGQHGIHGLWESRIPEIYGEGYDYYVGSAFFINHPLDEAWKSVEESNGALDSVLKFEKKLSQKFPGDKKFSYENRGAVLTRVYSEEYCQAYENLLSGMVERRLRSSILRVGSFWFSAWVEAGQPDLGPLLDKKFEPVKENFEPKFKIIDRENQNPGSVLQVPGEFHPAWILNSKRMRKKLLRRKKLILH